MSNQDADIQNSRKSYRTDDTVKLKVRSLDEKTKQGITDDFNSFRMRYCMKSHMQNQKEVRRPKLIRIRKRQPDVAEYLESLEVQISQIAERLDQTSESMGEFAEFTSLVNISASGIRFRTDLPLSEGESIEIGMVLSTQNIQVVVIGDILRVEDRPGNKYAVSVHYTHIHPEDAETIVRHLAKLQQIELQARSGIG